MKFASCVADGKVSFSVVVGDGVVDVPPPEKSRVMEARQPALRDAPPKIGNHDRKHRWKA
jgi:hypothetical protein